MGKRFKGETCAYCAGEGIATTADHVFGRAFFLTAARADLPKVPACDACNNEKSRLEHYLATVLPFGALHADAVAQLNDHVPARLAKNQRLHRELAAGRVESLIEDGGVIAPATTLPFDSDKLFALCTFIARGLTFYHWGSPIPAGVNVRAGAISSAGEPHFEKLLAMNGRRISGSVGNGTFDYEGVQSVADPHVSIWKFRIFGGVKLGGDPDAPDEAPTCVWVTSSGPGTMSLFDL